jgi:NAD(P)-dependent dehydrogenase (short-subunit alcohol dehydrogenase family)
MSQPAMNGKVCLITGANSGIGKATAQGLAQMGATVVMVCRDREKGEAVQREIKAASSNESVDLLLADLSSQQSIRQLASEIRERYPRLHVLINNAGISPSARRLTNDGIESTLAVNHLAPFLLTNLLLDHLKASAPARIVNVASTAMAAINFDDLQGEKRFNMMSIYGQSKMMNVLFTYELARRLEGTGVTVNCLHPGVVSTNLARDFTPLFRLLAQLFFISPEKGAQTSLYLASSPEVESVSGKYFIKQREAKSAPASYDEAAAKRLWHISEELTHLVEIPSN